LKKLECKERFVLDDEGVYYWHKRTGTVTRERPELIIDSPSSTLSSSSSNETCFEPNLLLCKSESNPSIKVIEIGLVLFFNRVFLCLDNG
jgi:hypothetical protein